MGSSSSSAKRLTEPKNYATLQPNEPRRSNWFCCPPYLLCVAPLVALGCGLSLPIVSFVLSVVFALYVCLCCPLATAYMWTRSWDWSPYEWPTQLYIKLTFFAYQSLLLSRKVPTAENDMPVCEILPKKRLEKYRITYALNIQVPKGTEEEFMAIPIGTSSLTQTLEESLSLLPMKDNMAEFAENEDPVAFVMKQLGSVYPEIYQVWDDKQSDQALTRFCLYGLGAHRVETTTVDKVKYYVLRTNHLSPLPMRDGFEHYGGDAYFDMNWNPVMIVDNGLNIDPDGICRGVVTTKVNEPGWDRAKFRFRSSMSVLVTVVDHLYGVHLLTANLMVTAVREQLSADHPVRRFMTPFTYQTISVNDNARNNLVQARAVAPRCFGFSDAGMNMAFAACPKLLKTGLSVSPEDGGPIIDRAKYVEFLKTKYGIDTEYYRQSVELYNIYKKFVKDYLAYYYPTPQDAVQDAEFRGFITQFFEQLVFVPPSTLTSLEGIPGLPQEDVNTVYNKWIDVISNFMYFVTAGHEQVGAIEAYVQDVSFCAFKWTPHSLIGTKQTATAQALLMSFTSTPMPKLLGSDWSHLFVSPEHTPKPNLKTPTQSFKTFQDELKAFSEKCDAYDKAAPTRKFPENFPMYVQNPKRLETSISV